MKKALAASLILCIFAIPTVVTSIAVAQSGYLTCDTYDCAAGYYCVDSPQGPSCVCACPSGYHCESLDFVNTDCVPDKICTATILNGYDVIRLGSGRPTWFAFVQPEGGCYANAEVVTSSLKLIYGGKTISAEETVLIASDRSRDGTEEIRASFSKTDLQTLFEGASLGQGHNSVLLGIKADLVTGGSLHGTTQVDVFRKGSVTAATVSPNPLNPSATLTFTTAHSGGARVDFFDVSGHLLRTLLNERSLAPGVHELRIDGQGWRDASLASGIYLIRGLCAEGEFIKRIAILK